MIPETNSFAEHLGPKERRMEEIVLEFLKAQDEGREPDRSRLLAQNPDLAGELKAFFADQNELWTLIPSIPGPTPPPTDAPTRVGDYVIVEEIGCGGMGVVYKARQANLVVALKMIRDRESCDAEMIERFRREVHIVAGFDHPNIVPLYYVGEFEGLPYFSMKYVEGGSLAHLPPALKGSPRAMAELMVKVARAVEYAHQHGILHRDLKPGNVLLDRDATPYVADFGLAKSVVDGQEDLTELGAVVGTCAFMSPEQASAAKHLTTRADVYGLGAILYQLLTGRPPFQGKDKYETVHRVRHEELIRPRALNRKLPRDLESICLHCLEKDPEKRYSSAAELAVDLERFLAGRPVSPQPVSPADRFLKWIKRRPAVAALSAAVFVTALIGLGAFVHQSLQTLDALEDAKRNLYVSRLFRIHAEINRGHLDLAENNLMESPERFRDWEWHVLRRWTKGDVVTLKGHDNDVQCVACSPDGKWIASGGSDGAVLLWPVADLGKNPITLEPHDPSMNKVRVVRFNRDGRRLATARDRYTVRVWDMASRQPLFDLRNAGDHVALSPDGELVAASKARSTRVWRVRDRHPLHTFESSPVNDLTFSPDGEVLVTISYGKEVRFWNLKSGREARPLRTTGTFSGDLAAFHPDLNRQQLAATEGSIVYLWDLKTHKEVLLHRGNSGRLTSLTYSEDGLELVTASNSGVLAVWDLQTHNIVFSARRGKGGVPFAAAMLPNDPARRLTYARGKDVVVEKWRFDGDRSLVLPHADAPCGVAFDPDGSLVTAAGDTLWRWDPQTGRETRIRHIPGLRPTCLALSPDGTTLAVGSEAKTIHILDARTGKLWYRFDEHTGHVRGLAFNATGDRLASASLDSTFIVWDLSRGEKLARQNTPHPLHSVAFDPDGAHLLVGGENGLLQLWPLQGEERPRELYKHENGVKFLVYGGDGRLLATASSDATVRLWDARTHVLLAKLDGHVGTVTGVAFTPDGRRLASSGMDGTIKIWDTAHFQELLSLGGHGKAALAVAFDRQGRRLAAAHSGGALRLWDGTPLSHVGWE
jgi:WD40 repeat protein/serine/threonine protein kinase